MSSPPPPYEDVAEENPALLEPSSTLVVHLQVWHYRTGGRSPADNDALAALFRNQKLQNWEVIPPELDGVTGPSSHDQYVPVEVQFRHRTRAYNDPGEHPMADVRELFFKVASELTYQFFIGIHSTPHNMNIFPIGIPKDFWPRYTHAKILNPLGIRINAFFVPGPARKDDVQAWLRDAVNTTVDVLDLLTVVVSVYLMYKYGQNQGDGNVPAANARGLHDLLSNVHVPEYLVEFRKLIQWFRQPDGDDDAKPAVQIEDVQVALDGAAGPLHQYLCLANRMENRLIQLKNNQTLSNQDLYELVLDTHSAALHFSALKQAVRPLVRLLEQDYDNVIRCYWKAKIKSGVWSAAAGFVTAFIFFWLDPASCPAAYSIAAGVAGLALGVGTHPKWDAERGKAFGRKDRVREFDIAIKELDRCANQAREAVAMVHCAQVMRKWLDEDLPEHDRRAFLAMLGVDVDAMPSSVYNEELIRDRIGKFLEGNRKLFAMKESVQTDANFEFQTTEQDAKEGDGQASAGVSS
ncbi:hypothetical protein SAMD00023353_4300020 [Rosellinia necatrix]|uniref:Uncharacterized protein n=1 Tax=Rosellinia necatrix TaxID=77044 RepID=A0A1W2TNM4_ROSNE|nr:hypothetical protein SAMD00023353_4300020 [Rosellinia necatrix]